MLKPCFFILLISMIFLSCQDKKDKESASTPSGPPPALSVEGLIAKPESLSTDIEVPGTILAFESTEIHPETSGRLVQLNINEGKYVSKGALLAKIFDGDLRAQLNKLEIQLKIADQTEKRQAQLLKIQGISQQEYDLSLLHVHNLKADMDIIQQEIRKTEIRAPFSGRLGLKNVSPGAYVSPMTVLTTISQVDRLKIQFNVPERYSRQVENGMDIHFTVDGSPKTFVASVLATEVAVEENTRSLAVRAAVKNKDATLVPGAFAQVRLVVGESEDAMLVPNNAIIPVGRKKQIFLYKGGKASMAEVVTGVRDSTNIQIIEGIKPGDTVITTGVLFLRQGSDVQLSKIE